MDQMSELVLKKWDIKLMSMLHFGNKQMIEIKHSLRDRLLPSPMINAMVGSSSSGGASNPTALLQKSNVQQIREYEGQICRAVKQDIVGCLSPGSSRSTSFPLPSSVEATKLALLKLPRPLLNEFVAAAPYVTVRELFSSN